MAVTNKQKRDPVKLYSTITAVASDFWGKPVYRAADGSLLCPGYTGNSYSLNPWDTLQVSLFGPFDEFETRFSKQQTPGIIRDFVVSKGLDVDERKSAGGNNARLTIHGFQIAKTEIRIELWTPMQWELMKRLWERLQPVSGKVLPGAVDCYHPELKAHGIGALQFLRGEGPVPGRIVGSRMFIIHAAEFNQPSKNNVTKTDEAPISTLIDPQTPGKNPANTGPT